MRYFTVFILLLATTGVGAGAELSYKITGSTACFVVPVVIGVPNNTFNKDNPETWDYYKNFISSFKNGEEGTVFIFRVQDIKDKFDSLKNYISNLLGLEK